MEQEKNIFTLIVKNSIFAFLKEKYPHYRMEDIKDDDNINTIRDLLGKLEKYAHIPDKRNIIEKEYNSIKSLMSKKEFQEYDFLESLKSATEALTAEEKDYILNAVIFVVNEDNKISDNEKEIILQIAKFLNIQHSYKNILIRYDKSEFKNGKVPIKLIISGLLIVLLIAAGLFWKVKNLPQVQTFETDKYQFDELTFNRYIIYKNKFDIGSEHFKKYAVYYISGTAQISFNPKRIEYNPTTKTITLLEKFHVSLTTSAKNEIDKVQAKAITEGQAHNIGVVVGLAGAYGGAKIGSSLSSILPKNIELASSALSGIIGGAAGYLVTTNMLSGAKLTSDISMTDKKETLRIGKQLIKAQLETDTKLLKMYRKHFELFIKAKYKTLNKEVHTVNYEPIENGGLN